MSPTGATRVAAVIGDPIAHSLSPAIHNAAFAAAGLDWVFLSPAGAYGAWAPGDRTGTYRLGGEVALFDADGGSNISGADFGVAIIDEIEKQAHHREHVGVAY